MADTGKRAMNIARGAISGMLATLAMRAVASLLESREEPAKEAFKDRKSAERMLVDRMNERFRWKLSRSRRALLARGLHLGVGAAAGAASTYLARQIGAHRSPLRAAVLAAATFALVEELFKPAIGTHAGPRSIPVRTQAAALAGKATYGFVQTRAKLAIDDAFSELPPALRP